MIFANLILLNYALVGGVMLAMTVAFVVTRRMWGEPFRSSQGGVTPVRMRAALRESLVWLQIAVFFLYTGLELTVGQWCFTVLTESRGAGTDEAGVLAG